MIHVHLVFVPKYRRGVFTKEILDDLRLIFVSVCQNFDAELVEFDGEDDHVHLLVNHPPKVAVSKLVNSLKGISSLLIRKRNYLSIKTKLWGNALWSPSYLATSCGARLLQLSENILNNSRLLCNIKTWTAIPSALSIPVLKNEVFRAVLIN